MVHTHDRASGSLAGPSVMQRKLAATPTAGATAPHEIGPDPLSEVLRTVKLTGALFFLVDATSPWGIEVPHASLFSPIILPRAQHVVSYHIILDGRGYVRAPGIPATLFEAGDIIVFPHADPYAMLSERSGKPEISAEESLVFFRDMAAGRLPFVVTEGGGGPDRARFVCGFLGCDMRPFNPLLETLPKVLHLKRSTGDQNDVLDRLIDLTLAEARNRRAGAESIRLGLSELIFVEVMRRYLATAESSGTGWLSGLLDPIVGRALGFLHGSSAQVWTLEELARQSGVSRSVLADRFTHLVGCPPMQYLTRWRMQLAARLLTDGSMKVAAVAQEVGYNSEAAFSRTFKRITGASPAAWRSEHSAARNIG